MTELLQDLFGDATAVDLVVAFLDVLIVYYLIYRVLLTIKGTRAAQMVIGIVLIGVGFFAAERLEMTTVSWILDNFINYLIIIVIVVFQQDIRRALMRIGQNVNPFTRTHESTQVLDQVIAATEHLAKGRIGAIVVFEREADLSDFVDHGEVLDARVTKQMLVTLFVPSRDNELHDGAVVIRNLRIHRAGAVLPLSRSHKIAREMGTRHRAALGITEETDAVALVVSEERGEVSLCFKGSIARDLESETLRTALEDLFYGDNKVSSKRRADEAHAAAEIGKAVAALARAGAVEADDKKIDETSPSLKLRASTQRAAEEAPS